MMLPLQFSASWMKKISAKKKYRESDLEFLDL